MSFSTGRLRLVATVHGSDRSPAVGAAGSSRRVPPEPIGAAPPPAVLAEVAEAGDRAAALAAAGREIHLRPAAGCGRLIGELRGLDGHVIRTLTPTEALDAMCGLAELQDPPAGPVAGPGSLPCSPGYAPNMDEQREIERLEDRSEHVEEQIEETRADWERKKADDRVPGAVGDVTDMAGDRAPETAFPGAVSAGEDVPDSPAEADRAADEHAED